MIPDPAGATKALIEAVYAAGAGDWPEAVEHLNSHPGLNHCTVLMSLAYLIASTVGDGEGPITCEVVINDEDADVDEREEATVIATLVAAVGNDDREGAHFIAHSMTERWAHRVTGRLLLMAHAAMHADQDITGARAN